VVNASAEQRRTVATRSGAAEVYLLTGDLDATAIALNGTTLVAHDDGTLPDLEPERVDGAVEIPPASIAYIVDPKAGDRACA
jgi:hypothetical protein